LKSVSFILPFVRRFTSHHAKFMKTVKILHDFSLKIISSRRNNMKKSGEAGFAYLDMILQTPIEGFLLTDEGANFE
jgi:hypothetical protein